MLKFKAFTRIEANRQKLPYDITALDSWSATDGKLYFIVCWEKCHVGIYEFLTNVKSKEPINLLKTFRQITPKPITKVVVVPEWEIFVALSDGEVFVHSLNNGQLCDKLKNVKTLDFSLDLSKLKSKEDMAICASTKKKLVIVQYSKRHECFNNSAEWSDYLLPSPPKGVAWLGESIVTCTRKDQWYYEAVSLSDGQTREMFPAGSMKHDAVMVLLPTRELAVLVDNKMIVLNKNLDKTGDVIWNDSPIGLVYSEPYFVALLPNFTIEVRAREVPTLLQKIEVEKVKLIAGGGNFVFLTNNRDIFYLEPSPFEKQCDSLVERVHHHLALVVAGLINEDQDRKNERRFSINESYAAHLFMQHKFKECFDKYLSINSDPLKVIRLFPNLLTTRMKDLLKEPAYSTPLLTGIQADEARGGLIDYLNSLRQIVDLERLHAEKTAQLPPHWQLQNLDEIFSLLDTTLLKCYIQNNKTQLVGPFVRRRGKTLDLMESERQLKKAELTEELVQLYQSKGEHKKALDLLKNCHTNPPTPSLAGLKPSIKYLQLLGKESMDIILTYSKWILEDDPLAGLSIFTEDSDEVMELDRSKVVLHLENVSKKDPSIVQKYLEHLVGRWKEERPESHNKLVNIYISKLRIKLQDQSKGTKGEKPVRMIEERKVLIKFLEESQHYNAEKFIYTFHQPPLSKLFHERAILLGRLEKHEPALTIYAHILKDHKMALRYCQQQYAGHPNVFQLLVKIYISRTEDPDLSEEYVFKQNVSAAVSVLNEHHDKIDTSTVLNELPATTKMADILTFLNLVFQECSQKRRQLQILRGLTYSKYLQGQKEKTESLGKAFLVSEEDGCVVCSKKLTSAFVREPDGRLRHIYCDL